MICQSYIIFLQGKYHILHVSHKTHWQYLKNFFSTNSTILQLAFFLHFLFYGQLFVFPRFLLMHWKSLTKNNNDDELRKVLINRAIQKFHSTNGTLHGQKFMA